MKNVILFISCLFVGLVTFSQIKIVYNQAGYLPQKEKRIIIQSDFDQQDKAWEIKNDLNQTVLSGTVGTSIQGVTDYTAKAFNHQIDFSSVIVEGGYTFSVVGLDTIDFRVICNPYQGHIHDVLKTIRARRSGSNDAIVHGLSHEGDTSCIVYRRGSNNSDWTEASPQQKVNAYGGWYDAGDYIKFTLTSAYTCYHLLKAYETYPELFTGVKDYSTTEWNDLLDEARHGLDFLKRTMPDENTFIIQTGGHLDHKQGLRLPENDALDGSRECYSAFSKTQMGLTVASLALGAKIFKSEGDLNYANELEAKALQIYLKAKSSSESPAWWQGGSEVFYADNSEDDNMELAALELYRLTNTGSYLSEASSYGISAGTGWWAAWSNVNMTAHSQLLEFDSGIKSYLTADLSNFRSIGSQSDNIWKAPHASTWGTLYSYFSVANGAMQYQKVSGSGLYEQMALNVLDYTFGVNPWGVSFLASEELPNPISSTYAVMYRLQPSIFPTGEIAEGPTTLTTHNGQKMWFSPAHDPNLWHSEYNVENFTFFEQPGDFVCMETTIGGLADGFYLLTLATGLYCENSTVGFDKKGDKSSIEVYPNPSSSEVNITIPYGNSYEWEIHSTSGNLISSGNEIKKPNLEGQEKGIYLLTVRSKEVVKRLSVVKE